MALSKYTILVVDDIPTNILLLKILLTREHCHVITANDGAHALVLAKEVHPDLLLLDIMMPDMNGFEVAEALHGNPDTSQIPILYLTALGDYPIEPNGRILKEEEYVTKPFDIHQLIEKILQILESSK
jgi:two-component system sensor histidine kinase/response regulator